jgi:hypothetical protein
MKSRRRVWALAAVGGGRCETAASPCHSVGAHFRRLRIRWIELTSPHPPTYGAGRSSIGLLRTRKDGTAFRVLLQ